MESWTRCGTDRARRLVRFICPCDSICWGLPDQMTKWHTILMTNAAWLVICILNHLVIWNFRQQAAIVPNSSAAGSRHPRPQKKCKLHARSNPSSEPAKIVDIFPRPRKCNFPDWSRSAGRRFVSKLQKLSRLGQRAPEAFFFQGDSRLLMIWTRQRSTDRQFGYKTWL